jgi:hypothetical protein
LTSGKSWIIFPPEADAVGRVSEFYRDTNIQIGDPIPWFCQHGEVIGEEIPGADIETGQVFIFCPESDEICLVASQVIPKPIFK